MAENGYTEINELTAKTAPVDDDNLVLEDSADSNAWKKLGIDDLSTKVQDDLMANDAVTEATVSTDTIPALVSSANKNITMQNLMIQMKGYKEYTFAIRQSGTDAPTISVIKDDFGLETPLSFARYGTGIYYADVSSLYSAGLDVTKSAIYISNQIANDVVSPTDFDIIAGSFVAGNAFQISTIVQTMSTGVSALADGKLGNSQNCFVSLRQPIT